MAETKDPGQQKSLEMRVAELEDKLSQMHISEQDMQTYQRVAAKLGVAQAQQPTTAAQAAISPYYHCYYYHCYYFRCYYYNDCIIGPQGGAGGGGGGFGGFGR